MTFWEPFAVGQPVTPNLSQSRLIETFSFIIDQCCLRWAPWKKHINTLDIKILDMSLWAISDWAIIYSTTIFWYIPFLYLSSTPFIHLVFFIILLNNQWLHYWHSCHWPAYDSLLWIREIGLDLQHHSSSLSPLNLLAATGHHKPMLEKCICSVICSWVVTDVTIMVWL